MPTSYTVHLTIPTQLDIETAAEALEELLWTFLDTHFEGDEVLDIAVRIPEKAEAAPVADLSTTVASFLRSDPGGYTINGGFIPGPDGVLRDPKFATYE